MFRIYDFPHTARSTSLTEIKKEANVSNVVSLRLSWHEIPRGIW